MAHEIDAEKLSAFIDDQLKGGEKQELEAHLKTCADCAGALARMKSASAEFKAQGAEKLPAAVAARALAKGKKPEMAAPLRMVLAFTAFVAAMLISGMLAKRFMPGLFSQIQGMISGAANNLGQ